MRLLRKENVAVSADVKTEDSTIGHAANRIFRVHDRLYESRWPADRWRRNRVPREAVAVRSGYFEVVKRKWTM
jgi:hypothetical protein